MIKKSRTFGVIGAGVMGRALLGGALKAGILSKDQVWAGVRSAETQKAASQELDVEVYIDYQAKIPHCEVVLICVKPYQIEGVLQELKKHGLPQDALVISIAAGVTLEQLQAALGDQQPVIRAMPNTPCVVHHGMSVICGGQAAGETHLQMARALFESVGLCTSLDEALFDAATAIVGSGPAFYYLILESIVDGGVRVGLPRAKAMEMVTQTVLGAAQMILKSGRHPASLRDDVTTPAGCTIGGLLVMEDGKIRSVLARAIEEATQIAGDLGRSKK